MESISGVLLLAAMAYLLSFGLQAGSGLSKTLSTPDHLVRLELINGSGDSDELAEWTSMLDGYIDPVLEIEVATGRQFKIRQLPESVIISRVRDLEAARLLATKLDLDPGSVFYRPLENNKQQISATLILGEDVVKLGMAGLTKKENSSQS